MVELEKLKTRVEACFQAGALATGCTYTTSMGMCYFGELLPSPRAFARI